MGRWIGSTESATNSDKLIELRIGLETFCEVGGDPLVGNDKKSGFTSEANVAGANSSGTRDICHSPALSTHVTGILRRREAKPRETPGHPWNRPDGTVRQETAGRSCPGAGRNGRRRQSSGPTGHAWGGRAVGRGTVDGEVVEADGVVRRQVKAADVVGVAIGLDVRQTFEGVSLAVERLRVEAFGGEVTTPPVGTGDNFGARVARHLVERDEAFPSREIFAPCERPACLRRGRAAVLVRKPEVARGCLLPC